MTGRARDRRRASRAVRRVWRAGAAWLAAAAVLAGCGGRSATRPPALAVVAGGLANPRQISVGPDGALYVAEAGSGGHAQCGKDPGSGQRICVGLTGSIARAAHGRVTRVITGLPSVAGSSGAESSGPAAVIAGRAGGVALVTQDTQIGRTGANHFGTPGRLLGRLLVVTPGGRPRSVADLARFEAAHNPDRGAGAGTADAIESDPYGLATYRGGYAVADAAGNDVLWVDAAGRVRVLAVLPVQYEVAPAGVVAKAARRVTVQSVPTSVVVGPDGALYVGELTGFPFDPGFARVWRLVPGQRPTVFAAGFTNISALAFDRRGQLLVLEINRAGLRDSQAPGELIRLDAGGRRTVLASTGLSSATGLAVAAGGAILVAINGTSPANGTGAHGEIVRVPST